MLRILLKPLNGIISKKTKLVNDIRKMSTDKVTGPVVGIDLGTTNSCVAIMEGDVPKVIANVEGCRTTPSVVAFASDGEIIVGEAAKRQAVSNSKNTIYGTKRLIGRLFDDPEVKDEASHIPFELVRADNGDCWVRARNKNYSPSQIGGYVLNKMKQTAASYLGLPVCNAVITVPAYFNDSQRQATKDSGQIAGLNVVRIINEPTAAALSYGLNKKSLNKIIAVYDLGGGTFDISILEINDGVFEVKSTNGDTRLGGEDFDNVIIKHLIELINKDFKTDVRQDLKALQRIKEAAEKAKIELSFSVSSEINLPYLIGANSFSHTFKKSKLEELVGDLIRRTIEPCKKAIQDAGLSVSKLDEVLLVGGMTRMPKVEQTVKEFFKREPSKNVNPDEAVAIGAAVQGAVLTGNVTDIVLVDVTPYSLGIQTKNDVFCIVVPKNTSIPTRKSEIFSTSEDNQTSVCVSVYQGERSLCEYNLKLGDFMLGPIPARPRAHSKIEVTFELDSNGIANVHAMDVESNQKANTVLKSNPRGLSREELEKIALEAKKEQAADEVRKNIAVAKGEADSLCYDCNRFIQGQGSNLSKDEIDHISAMANDLKTNYIDAKKVDIKEMLQKINLLVQELSNLRSKVEKDAPKDTSDSTTPTDSENTKAN